MGVNGPWAPETAQLTADTSHRIFSGQALVKAVSFGFSTHAFEDAVEKFLIGATLSEKRPYFVAKI